MVKKKKFTATDVHGHKNKNKKHPTCIPHRFAHNIQKAQ